MMIVMGHFYDYNRYFFVRKICFNIKTNILEFDIIVHILTYFNLIFKLNIIKGFEYGKKSKVAGMDR